MEGRTVAIPRRDAAQAGPFAATGPNGGTTTLSVSVVVPAYNEAAVIAPNLEAICRCMGEMGEGFHWEVIVVNDGSRDGTGPIVEAFAAGRTNVRVIHHVVNFGLGQALRSAFNASRSDFVLTLDADLSYGTAHIRELLETIQRTHAKVVIASPYARGGRLSNVPLGRRVMSRAANRFLSWVAPGRLSTFTGMVRAYDGPFVRSLSLKCMGMDINSEILYKALLMRAMVVEVPALLDWGSREEAAGRRSAMKVRWNVLAVLFSGFLFKPFMFFVLPGAALLALSAYVNAWAAIHVLSAYQVHAGRTSFVSRASYAVADAYALSPHTFVVGGLTLMLAIQLISLGVLALQSKRYFEELFHLGTTSYRFNREQRGGRG